MYLKLKAFTLFLDRLGAKKLKLLNSMGNNKYIEWGVRGAGVTTIKLATTAKLYNWATLIANVADLVSMQSMRTVSM